MTQAPQRQGGSDAGHSLAQALGWRAQGRGGADKQLLGLSEGRSIFEDRFGGYQYPLKRVPGPQHLIESEVRAWERQK